MDALVLLGSFGLLCALGVPVAYALGLAALIAAFWIDVPLEAVILKVSDGTDDFALLAIPFFVLAGAIMAEGGMARRLIDLARLFVGAPSAKLRHVAEARTLHVLICNFDNQLGPQWLPRKILAFAPAALASRHTMPRFTRLGRGLGPALPGVVSQHFLAIRR